MAFTLKIEDIKKSTPDVVTICFKQPALKKVKYKAGQYLTLIVRINNRKYIRPYSFSSAPGIDTYLEVTIKRVPGGVVSNYLYDHAKIGDMMEVIEPMGDFVFDPVDETYPGHIMLWGAGSGITPLMSILKTILNRSAEKKVSLFYCNRNPEHTIFHDELSALDEKYANLTIHNFYTRIPEEVYLNYYIAGRIDEGRIIDILSKSESLDDTIHYICGPAGLKENVKSGLEKLKVKNTNILTEEFEVLIDPQLFDEIETQTIVITNGNEEWDVEVVKGASILNAALDQLIDLPYSCQTGTCMLCKAKLMDGKVSVIGVDELPDELEPGDCLLCCSYPQTDNVKILIN